MMSSIVRSIVVLLLAQSCCADSLRLPINLIGDDVSGSSALCMLDFSLRQADANLMNLQTTKIPKTLPLATTHADGDVIPTTTKYVAPPSIDWNVLATHASFAAAPIVAISRMISVIIGGSSPQLTIINQGEKVATTPSPTILMRSASEAYSTSHVGARGKEEGGALTREEAILHGLGGADENRMKSQTLEISKTHTLAETYDIWNNALGNEEECALALALAFEETINGLEETAHEAVIELPTNLGWVPMPWLYGNSVISAVICFILLGSVRLSKIIVSGRRMIMMKPSAVVTCLTLVACFAGHAVATETLSDYPSESPSTEFWGGYPEGLCLQKATGSMAGCTANDFSAVVTNYTGPSNCDEGKILVIESLTTSIKGQAKSRYDVGIYIGLGENSNAKTGESCLVQTLSPVDSTVKDLDKDRCLDYQAFGTDKTIDNFVIQDFGIECKTGANSNGKAVISACFAWDQNDDNICPSTCFSDPDQKCVILGTTSKCACSELEIEVTVNSASPSSSPSKNPSENPSENPSQSPSNECDPFCKIKFPGCNDKCFFYCLDKISESPSEIPSEDPTVTPEQDNVPLFVNNPDGRRLSLMQIEMEELKQENARLVERLLKMEEEDVRKSRLLLDSYSSSTNNNDPPGIRGGQIQTQEFEESTQ